MKAKVGKPNNFSISSNKLLSIPNYTPNPDDYKYHVLVATDVDIFRPVDPSKPNTAVKALYCVATIADTEANFEFIDTYGSKVIIVSKRFTKLKKKYQTMIVERICFEKSGVPLRFSSGLPGITSTDLDRRVAADLQLMEKYGYTAVKRLSKKEHNFNLGGKKKAGKALYKIAKKSSKTAKANSKETTGEKIKEPSIFTDDAKAGAAPAGI